MPNSRELKCPRCKAMPGLPCHSNGKGVRDHLERRKAAGIEAIKIVLLPREDGGLRIYSPTNPGLILSGSNPKKVMASVWPALTALRNYKRKQNHHTIG